MSQAANKVTPFPGADAGRSLPHSDEAERCLLGSLLLNPQAVSECIEKFASKDPETRGGEFFYNEKHDKFIYQNRELDADEFNKLMAQRWPMQNMANQQVSGFAFEEEKPTKKK